MYAVIKTGGKQYKVAAGDVVKIEKITKVVTLNGFLVISFSIIQLA